MKRTMPMTSMTYSETWLKGEASPARAGWPSLESGPRATVEEADKPRSARFPIRA